MSFSHREPERRLATVLFADISGFTSMSEKLDPEDLTFLMNRCFGLMETIIETYGGTIDKFIGDCIMALFGVPAAVEKGPLKAVHTAVAIKEKLDQLNREKKIPAALDVHIGINTGAVVAGEVGGRKRREYTVMGDAVNVAAKLERASHAGQILVGSATYHRAKEDFRFRPLGPIRIDGKRDLVPVYELLAKKKRVSVQPLEVNGSIGPGMVGREKEMGLLADHLLRLVSGKGAIVSLTGEAGIGKTRLMTALKQNRMMGRVLLLEGHTNAIGENLSYHPMVDLLKNWSGIKADAGDKKSFRILEKAVKSVFGEKSPEALPFIAVLMGLRIPGRYTGQVRRTEGSALRTLIHKTIRELLWRAASRQPVVMVIEDLHWLDKSSALLLAALFDLARSRPILFINVFRPHQGGIIDLMMEKTAEYYPGHYSEIHVPPLGKKQASILINNLLDTDRLPSPVQHTVLQRAGGNPFFIEEVIHALIDRGTVVRRNGRYVAARPMGNEIIPQDITDVVMERIDRLGDPTRQVLRVASVIGQIFSGRIISAVLPGIDNVDRALRNLIGAQFILARKNGSETDYVFKHAIAREVAYHSILYRTRKALHRSIAGAIEAVFEKRLNRVCGMLAFHYSCGEDLEKAEKYMTMAGEEALNAGASSEALHYYKAALDIYLKKYKDVANPEKIKTMNKNIARSLLDKGRHAEALEYYTKALGYYGMTGFKHPLVCSVGFFFNFCNLLVSLYVPLFKWRKVPTQQEIEMLKLLYHRAVAQSSLAPQQFIRESFSLSRRLSKFDLTRFESGIGMFIGLSIALSWSVASLSLSRKILAFVKPKIRSEAIGSRLYFNLAEVLQNYYSGWVKNNYDDRLVSLALNIGEVSHAAAYISYHGRIKIECGLYGEASELVDRLAGIMRTYSHGFARALKYFLNTKLLMKYRKLNAALIEAEEGVLSLSPMDFMQIMMVLHLCRARIHLLLDDAVSAQAALDEVETIKSDARVLPPYMSNYLVSHALMDLYRFEKAFQEKNQGLVHRYQRQALASCRRLIQISGKIAFDRPEAYRIMGSCLWMAGRHKAALRNWKKSIAVCEQLGARVELARSCMEIGKRLTEPGSRCPSMEGIGGKQYLFRAEMIFTDLGLLWDLRALKNIFPRHVD